MLINNDNGTLAYNGWVYMQCEIRTTELHLTTNFDQNDKLDYVTEPHITYTPCYTQCGLLRQNVDMKREQKLFKNVWWKI